MVWADALCQAMEKIFLARSSSNPLCAHNILAGSVPGAGSTPQSESAGSQILAGSSYSGYAQEPGCAGGCDCRFGYSGCKDA